MIAAMHSIGEGMVAAVRITAPMIRQIPLEWPSIGWRIEGPDTSLGRALVQARYKILRWAHDTQKRPWSQDCAVCGRQLLPRYLIDHPVLCRGCGGLWPSELFEGFLEELNP